MSDLAELLQLRAHDELLDQIHKSNLVLVDITGAKGSSLSSTSSSTTSESLSKPRQRQKRQQGWTTKQSAMGGDDVDNYTIMIDQVKSQQEISLY